MSLRYVPIGAAIVFGSLLAVGVIPVPSSIIYDLVPWIIIFVVTSAILILLWSFLVIFKRRFRVPAIALIGISIVVALLFGVSTFLWLSTGHRLSISSPNAALEPPAAPSTIEPNAPPRPPVIEPGTIPGFAHFPWPPPNPSAIVDIPINRLHYTPTLFELGVTLVVALSEAGFSQRSFYYIPDGFALAASLEQIENDGTPLPGSARWNPNLIVGMRSFSLSEYIRVLFSAPEGRYRIIVFAVTGRPFYPIPSIITRETAMEWSLVGSPFLPSVYGRIPVTSDTQVVALIYEFFVPGRSDTPFLVAPSGISAEQHLIKSHVWQSLRLAAIPDRLERDNAK